MAATATVVAVVTVAFMAATAAVAQPSLVSEATFNEMLKHRDDTACHGDFYTYSAFTDAARAFPDFATTGDTDTRKRELAAFFAQTSQETTGGWPTAPDGPYAWGYCFVLENNGNAGDYCQQDPQWGCAPGKKYYGRGPIQLTGNHNYGEAGKALRFDGINDPDIVGRDATISFKAALWFWMTPQSPKPSCHDVITGKWTPSANDMTAGRKPGLGVITNIINSGVECGQGPVPQEEGRIDFYKRYCDILDINYGDNLDCRSQQHF